jgi:rhodanese-related sulfurtransferase
VGNRTDHREHLTVSRHSTRAATLVLAALMAMVLTACGGSPGPAIQKVDAGTAVTMLHTRTVIDVRTPQEFAAGHLEGARNVDVEAADFASKIASLDKGAPYLVYCHSGRRSAIAAAQMATAGFTDIVDGGAMADLVAAGAPTQ